MRRFLSKFIRKKCGRGILREVLCGGDAHLTKLVGATVPPFFDCYFRLLVSIKSSTVLFQVHIAKQERICPVQDPDRDQKIP